MIVEYDCITCGKHVRKRRSPANGGAHARYCSIGCYNAARARIEPRVQEPNHAIQCEQCGRQVQVYRSPSAPGPRFCSVKCTGAAQRGEANPSWAGGTRRHARGYIWRYVPDHPDADVRGCVLEHRLVMESVIGRRLRPEEVVHHINRVKDDNRPENLQLLPNQAAHSRLHKAEDRKAI